MQQLFLPVMLGLLYFFMIRPQQRRTREQKALLSRTSNGDRVVLTSGIYGLVLDTNGDVLKIGTSPDTYLFVARAAVGRRLDPSDELSPPAFMLASEDDIAAIPPPEEGHEAGSVGAGPVGAGPDEVAPVDGELPAASAHGAAPAAGAPSVPGKSTPNEPASGSAK